MALAPNDPVATMRRQLTDELRRACEYLRSFKLPRERKEVVTFLIKYLYKVDDLETRPKASAVIDELLRIGVLYYFHPYREILDTKMPQLLERLVGRLPPPAAPSRASTPEEPARSAPPGLLPERTRAVAAIKTAGLRFPVQGRALADLLAPVVGEQDAGFRSKTSALMAALVRERILAEQAGTGWYSPGPNYSRE